MSKPKKHDVEDLIMAYEAYAQTIERLQHFNRMQTTYRTFAFTWLAATFFGIGYSLSSREINLPFPPLMIVVLLCVLSSAGIVLIWYMDLIMCERMIATALFEGLEYEKEFEWIPKVHQTSNSFHGLWGYVHLKALFYVGCFLIIYGTMGVALGLLLKDSYLWIISPFVSLSVVVLFFYVSFYFLKKTDPYERLEKFKE